MRNITTTPTTQTVALADHLQKQGSISGLEALALYRVVSLTKVISVMKRMGISIVGVWKRDNTGKRYKRYFLAQTLTSKSDMDTLFV